MMMVFTETIHATLVEAITVTCSTLLQPDDVDPFKANHLQFFPLHVVSYPSWSLMSALREVQAAHPRGKRRLGFARPTPLSSPLKNQLQR